jgi:hypothetical protein
MDYPSNQSENQADLVPHFDYGDLPQSSVSILEQIAEEVQITQLAVRKTTSEAVLKIGEALFRVHDTLAGSGRDGMWKPWVSKRCGFSLSTAENAIRVYKAFGEKKVVTVTHFFEPSAMYLLSRDSCPEEATKEALKLAKKGEVITAKTAKAIVAKHSEPVDDHLDWLDAAKQIKSAALRISSRVAPDAKPTIPEGLRRLADQIDSGEQKLDSVTDGPAEPYQEPDDQPGDDHEQFSIGNHVLAMRKVSAKWFKQWPEDDKQGAIKELRTIADHLQKKIVSAKEPPRPSTVALKCISMLNSGLSETLLMFWQDVEFKKKYNRLSISFDTDHPTGRALATIQQAVKDLGTWLADEFHTCDSCGEEIAAHGGECPKCGPVEDADDDTEGDNHE